MHEWKSLTCVHDAAERCIMYSHTLIYTHPHRSCSVLPQLYLPTVAQCRSAAPYWLACHSESYNHSVKRAGTHGTLLCSHQEAGFQNDLLSICLNANIWGGRFLDYLHLQSRLGVGSIGKVERKPGLLWPVLLVWIQKRIYCFHILDLELQELPSAAGLVARKLFFFYFELLHLWGTYKIFYPAYIAVYQYTSNKNFVLGKHIQFW